MKTLKILFAAMILVCGVMLTGCGNSDDTNTRTIAICFPGGSGNWERNGNALKSSLEEEGFIVDINFAGNVAEQQQQIKDAIAKKPSCLTIGAVDSSALVEVLENAKAANIPVVAFDRLIMNTDAVSYYASFDNDAVGEAQGLYFESALNLRSGSGSYNIEFFAGDPGDNNAHVFFDSAMKVLQPYISKGTLVCRSQQTDFNSVAVKDWNPENARTRIKDLLSKYYASETLNAVLCPNDDVAGVIAEEFQKAGKPVPLISGQDGTSAAINRVKSGQQTFTINKDAAELNSKCVRMIKAVVEGTEPKINDVTTYNNGVKVVPAYLCTPLIVDSTNVKDF